MIQNKKIARRYAKAFLHDNLGKNEIDVLTNEIMSFVMVLESDEKVREFFISPVNSKNTKVKVIKNLAKKIGFSTYTVSLIEILINNDRMKIIFDVFEELQKVSDKIHDRVRIKMTTAYEPSVEDIKELNRRISSYFGRNAIVDRKIDSSIIGGFILEGEGKLVDMSIKGQIERALSEI